MGYDSRCYDLAALFLSDSPEKNTGPNRDALARHIQDELEGWIEYILKPPIETADLLQCGYANCTYPDCPCDTPGINSAQTGPSNPPE